MYAGRNARNLVLLQIATWDPFYLVQVPSSLRSLTNLKCSNMAQSYETNCRQQDVSVLALSCKLPYQLLHYQGRLTSQQACCMGVHTHCDLSDGSLETDGGLATALLLLSSEFRCSVHIRLVWPCKQPPMLRF